MGQRDKECSNEVNLLLNLCKHHEQTIANMFAIQEPVMAYARLMRFISEYPEYVDFQELSNCGASWEIMECVNDYITHWENEMEQRFKPDWTEE